MAQDTKSLGQAIDQILNALNGLDAAGQIIAIKAACESLGLTIGQMKTVTESGFSQSSSQAEVVSVPSQTVPLTAATDIRTLKDLKKPGSAIEMACIVAYYLRNLAPADERLTEITSTEIEKYFIQADYPLPKVKGQVLIDAKAAGYFDRTADGRYKLNAVGHNLVVHGLPRASGVQIKKKKTPSKHKTKSQTGLKRKPATSSR